LPAALWLAAHRPPGAGRPAPIHQLPDDLFAEAIRRLGGTPDEVLAHPELLELFLPVLRADFALLETYDPPAPGSGRAPLACPLTVFGGEDDEVASPAQLAHWRAGAGGPFRLKLYPGGHFFFSDHEAALLGEVLADLRAIEGGG
ncbi:MAG TPA: thioesterase domain-containing protein, partial [Herpetosiphonaceae bacterium]